MITHEDIDMIRADAKEILRSDEEKEQEELQEKLDEIIEVEEPLTQEEKEQAVEAVKHVRTAIASNDDRNIRKVIAGMAAGQMLGIMGQPADDYARMSQAFRAVNRGRPMRPPKRNRHRRRRG